ncbi:MAG: helix-turn-helix domain-containing protein [Rhodospirillales bacterium]
MVASDEKPTASPSAVAAAKPGISSETFKAFRARLGLTQAEAARLCGVDRRTVTTWEKGKTPIEGPVVAFIRAFLLLRAEQQAAWIDEVRNQT